MKLVRASCQCGFSTNTVRWGYHFLEWWFPTYDVRTGRLAEEHFRLPDDEQRRLMSKCTTDEIAARRRGVEEELTGRLRERYRVNNLDNNSLIIDERDRTEAKLLCSRCHRTTLKIQQVIVWANCRTDCAHRYQWIDSEELGCPICSHRPHSFQIEDNSSGSAMQPDICSCGCSSYITCCDHEDCFCPKCCKRPTGYEHNGIAYCGLHHRQLIIYKIPLNFLLMTAYHCRDSDLFPNAKLFGEARDGEESLQCGYCDRCEVARCEWMASHQ